MTVAAAVMARALARPDGGALALGARRWSAAELAADVAAAGGWLAGRLAAEPLRAEPAVRAPRVAICVPDPADQLVWALGADRVGAAAAVLDVSWPRAQMAAALDQIRPALIVRHRPDHVTSVDVSAMATRSTDATGGWISFTSGTSGAPRALSRTRDSWTASFPAFSRLTGVTAADTVLVPGPLSSSMFAFAAFHALAAGACVQLLPKWSPTFRGGPEITVAHLVPTMLADLLGSSAHSPRVVVTAGAKLPAGLEASARDTWPGVTIVEYYGSSEQSFVTARVGGDPGTVGGPFPGVDMQIRGADDAVVPPGVDGQIWSRSPFGCDDALGPAAGRLCRDGDWLSVGDRGRLDRHGSLVLSGRGAILTGGCTVLAAAVEAILAAAPGVADVVVIGLPHERLGEIVAAVLEPLPGATLARRELREWARSRLTAVQQPRRWYVVPRLPRTATGKAARAEIIAGALAGELDG